MDFIELRKIRDCVNFIPTPFKVLSIDRPESYVYLRPISLNSVLLTGVHLLTYCAPLYREARLLVPCLMVQPPLLFKICQEWNGLGFYEVKLLGLLFRKALIIVQFN